MDKRTKNNLASQKSYEKTKFQKESNDFETYSVRKCIEENKTFSFIHWKLIPHEWLYQSGYITDFNKYRYKNIEAGKSGNVIDIVFDFMGKQGDVFIGGQSKLYQDKINLNKLGTFIAKVSLIQRKTPYSSGIVCSVNGLTSDTEETLNGLGINHKKLNYSDFQNYLKSKSQTQTSEITSKLRDYQTIVKEKILLHNHKLVG